ncbi:phosphotransferase [Vibrio maerlii]|uniref:phosphotransferase n=1 Tax=Vibrio maerlii TaxID=2231648 RepID=UPI000E3D0984|nr:phosphotransferase [Vibrio maerlii]
MTNSRYDWVKDFFGADRITSVEVLQTLWSGYGELARVALTGKGGTIPKSIIVKYVDLESSGEHPRGWNTQLSHLRKVHSYQVEANWYQDYSKYRKTQCYWPKGMYTKSTGNAFYILMEDLSTAGYEYTTAVATSQHLAACLRWLAHFHARFISVEPTGLWETGTYWHLDTRPDELNKLDDVELKQYAAEIDRVLNSSPYKTIVHGDAKLANFCFDADGTKAAAVDFQYVGGGCAMKDVALFMSSAVEPKECADKEVWILDTYFSELKLALLQYHPHLDSEDVESAWRPLFSLAWADFHRFVKGWKPGHWKINFYTEALTQSALRTHFKI